MEALVAIQSIFLFVLIIGLIKPKAILFWTPNKTRRTVFLQIGLPWIGLSIALAGWKKLNEMPTEEKISFIQEQIDALNFHKADSALLSLSKTERDSCAVCSDLQKTIDSVKLHNLAIENQLRIESEIASTKEALISAIESFPKIDFSVFYDTPENLSNALLLIKSNSDLHRTALNLESSAPELKTLINKHKAITIAKQKKSFPELRKQYIKLLDQRMWEHNIDIEAYGSNKNLVFTGGIYANNKNIQDSFNAISSILTEFRFNRVYFRWIKSDTEMTYYNLTSLSDSEI